MPSLDLTFLNTLSYSSGQLGALRQLGEYKGREQLYQRQTPEILESLKKTALIESSESSNRIEGIVAPRNRVQKIVLETTEPRNRPEQEIAGYRDALALIHESASHMPVSVNVILQLHSMIHKYMPAEGGRWKQTNNEIVERASDGTIERVRFKPVSAIETPVAMDALIDRYKASLKASVEPLVVIPLLVFDFLCIHPFTDGNGRVSRLLTLLLLYKHGFEVGRFISTERIFEESKETYYETLEASSQNWHESIHDVHPWMNYFWGVILRSYKEFEERVGEIRTGHGAKSQLVRDAVHRKSNPFAISDIMRECPGVSRDMVRVVLRKLRDEGTIEQRGRGRASKWHPVQ